MTDDNRRILIRNSRTKWGSQFGLAVLTLALLPLIAEGQCPLLNVKATCGTPSPEWSAWGQPTLITLSAETNAPAPDKGSTLQGPTWNWIVLKIEYSDDGVTFTEGGTCSTEFQNENSANASLKAWFYQGAYWRITCQVTAGYSETPGTTTWVGTATCAPLPNSGELVGITVSSGATQTNVSQTSDYPNWAAVKSSGNQVIINATVKPNTVDAANLIQWTNGDAVAEDNTVRTVDKSISAMTAVTAIIGEVPAQEVDIWILWATIVNQMTGTTPPNATQFGKLDDGTENLGTVQYSDGNWASGKVCPVGTITPPGSHNVAKDGWSFKRDKWRHDFRDGTKNSDRYDTTWQGDDSNVYFLKLNPDIDDKIYDLDGPSIGNFGVLDSYERYDNFRQYIQWNGEMCSDYAGWYWQARWKKNGTGTNQVVFPFTNVAQGALDLSNYTTAFYPAP